jgi:hypothetical protein
MLLAVSGVLTVVASLQRWGCRIGEFPYANDECWMREDGLYVYVHPSVEPVPLASAAEHHGVGMLVLAVAVLLFPWVLAGRWPGWMLTIASPVVAAGVAASALPTFLSSLEGEAVSLPDMWLAEVLLLLGLPALLIASAVQAAPGPRRAGVARWAAVFCLSVAPNMIFMYSSWDMNPWTETIGGVLLIAGSACLWLTVQRDQASGTDERGDVGAPLVTT